ncbi:MAG TPA: penicillin-binding protein 2 [Planctomycetota bacterium]|nr:penicillin-binding protein 2 [Planctomycetota bacterium]
MMLRARRLVYVFSAILMVALGGLVLRLVWLQVAGADDALERRDRLADGASLDLARRGALRDRHGQIVADSVEQVRVTAYARDITHDGRLARTQEQVARSVSTISQRLAPLLGLPAAAIAPQLLRTGDDGRPQQGYVGEPVTDASAIDALMGLRDGDLRRIGLEPRWERRYPAGSAAGNLLGVVNFEGHGAFGLELGLEKVLACGADGTYPHQRLGSFRVATAEQEPRPSLAGYDVELTIDSVVQRVLAEELAAGCTRLKAVGGSAVMLDVATGDILGMASVPGLDPTDGRTWTDAAQIFRPAQTVYSPGSTFKPVMLATALDLGLVEPGAKIDCSAKRGVFGKRVVRDTHPIEGGSATLEDIIVHSSNIGMSNILTKLVPEGSEKDTERMRPVYDILCRLGVPQTTGVPIAGESAGLLTPLSQWTRNYTLVSVSFGHEISVTPLQMAAITATLAEGQWRRPRLVRAFLDEGGRRIEVPQEAAVRVFLPETTDLIRGYMQAVVDKGQAKAAGVKGVAVAGKTGTTVHDPIPGRKEAKSGETHSFIALVPADAPQVALVVAIEQPQGFRFAAQTVAPVTGAILNRVLPYLGIAEAR